MCGEQIAREICTIRKLSGAEKQQIVFSELILLYFFGLIEHELSTDTAKQIKVYHEEH